MHGHKHGRVKHMPLCFAARDIKKYDRTTKYMLKEFTCTQIFTKILYYAKKHHTSSVNSTINCTKMSSSSEGVMVLPQSCLTREVSLHIRVMLGLVCCYGGLR